MLKTPAQIIICILSFFLLYSYKSGLSEKQQLFLDYAKLEDRYHNTNYYLDLDVYGDTIAAPVYSDAVFSVDEFRQRLKKSFKLIKDEQSIVPTFDGAALQYPHQYIFTKNSDSSFNVVLSVFIPDHFSKISLSKKDIGKVIKKEEAEFTLLDLTNDVATLLVTDKATRINYDYTYDGFEQKNNKDKEIPEVDTMPGYRQGLFLEESVTPPNTAADVVTDSMLRLKFGRVNISLSNKDGRTIASEGRINSFRHYLWYRNHDMPFEELRADYLRIKAAYKEEDTDTAHRFNPIDIINVKGVGTIGSVEIFVRSAKGHVERFDLGKHTPQANISKPKAQTQNEQRYAPINTLDSAEASKIVKSHYNILRDDKGREAFCLLYASLPVNYKRAFIRMEFEDVWLKTATDSVKMEMEDAENYFDIGDQRKNSNITAVKMPLPQQGKVTSIKGQLIFTVKGLYDTAFKIGALPQGMSFSSDGLTVTILPDLVQVESIREIYGFGDAGRKNLLQYVSKPASDEDEELKVTITFDQKPSQIVIRSKRETDQNFSIPLEFVISKQ